MNIKLELNRLGIKSKVSFFGYADDLSYLIAHVDLVILEGEAEVIA